MKKIILVLCVMMILLAGCSRTITCDECGERKKGKTYKITYAGETVKEDICNDCIKFVKPLVEMLGGTIK